MLHATLSGDIFLKSRRTQPRMIKRARANIAAALQDAGHSGRHQRVSGHRLAIDAEAVDEVLLTDRLTRVFGVSAVETVAAIPAPDLDTIVSGATEIAGSRVAGRTFAVRPKRQGTHGWRSQELANRLGDELRARGGTVDLDAPDVTVRVTVINDTAYVVDAHVAGPAGLPIGTQDTVLTLLSGGFDSVVATWMMMSRGSTPEIVHFTLNCAQSDHALAVAHELHGRWGYGTEPVVHLVEFQPVKEALLADVDAKMRQVALKVLMAQAAAAVADEERILALVTGDSLGQVSSQTLPHLAAVSRSVETPILRPLVGLPKETIIDMARRIGTAEMSARAREVCDLSEGGPVATAAREAAIRRSVGDVPGVLMRDAVSSRKTFLLRDWMPGVSTTADQSAFA